jgi:hypothetical protein
MRAIGRSKGCGNPHRNVCCNAASWLIAFLRGGRTPAMMNN